MLCSNCLVHVKALKLCFLSLTRALRIPQENEHAGPYEHNTYIHLLRYTRMCTHSFGEQSSGITASLPREHEANIPDSICCSLWWRDNALAKHYNQQAREVIASPRITTAEKCLSLTISMSATLTSLPLPISHLALSHLLPRLTPLPA